MITEPQASDDAITVTMPETPTPSLKFIHAVSEFLDTDPSDLLVELGYYSREENPASV
jgi:hypothetical protein